MMVDFDVSSSGLTGSAAAYGLFVMRPSFDTVGFAYLLPLQIQARPFALAVTPVSMHFGESAVFILPVFSVWLVLFECGGAEFGARSSFFLLSFPILYRIIVCWLVVRAGPYKNDLLLLPANGTDLHSTGLF